MAPDDPTLTDEQRRTAALATMTERFPAVEERLQRVYGLRLPRHLAVFAAFWSSLNRPERRGMDSLGLSPWGIEAYFHPGGLDRSGRDGLDERLHCRFRCDPAEFVTVLSGDSDGLHFGLWYDDPAELPSFIAYNYARDSAETWTARCSTVLGQIRVQLGRSLEDYPGERDGELEPLSRALDWFEESDARALAEDGERRWADAPREPGSISIGAALPPGSGDPRSGEARHRLTTYRRDPEQGRQLIEQARAELAAGAPAFALTVGGELHWLDRDEYRQDALDLLTGAYRALGRDALAAIAEVHVAHRDLRSVDVLR